MTTRDGQTRDNPTVSLLAPDDASVPIRYTSTPSARTTGCRCVLLSRYPQRLAAGASQVAQYAAGGTADGYVWINPADGRLEYANEAACRTLGFTREELAPNEYHGHQPRLRCRQTGITHGKNCIRNAWSHGKACTALVLVRRLTSGTAISPVQG